MIPGNCVGFNFSLYWCRYIKDTAMRIMGSFLQNPTLSDTWCRLHWLQISISVSRNFRLAEGPVIIVLPLISLPPWFLAVIVQTQRAVSYIFSPWFLVARGRRVFPALGTHSLIYIWLLTTYNLGSNFTFAKRLSHDGIVIITRDGEISDKELKRSKCLAHHAEKADWTSGKV